MMIIVSYGGGTNSTAMLIGMREQGLKPDAIIFCDTKGEKPHTYKHIEVVSKWCIENGFPEIIKLTNEKASRKGGLENMCLEAKSLPSIAYGFKTCSLIFKKEPFDDWIKAQGITKFERWIGIDAGEPNRAKVFEGTRYPLIEWGWGRKECVEAIARAKLPQPGKSACFFCPSSKQHEILELKKQYPELAARAVAMEKNAIPENERFITCNDCKGTKIVKKYTEIDNEHLEFEEDDCVICHEKEVIEYIQCPKCKGSGLMQREVVGLGRNYAWADLIRFDEDQYDLFEETDLPVICECYDGCA